MPQLGCQVLAGKFLPILVKQSISREGTTEKPSVSVLFVTDCCRPNITNEDYAKQPDSNH